MTTTFLTHAREAQEAWEGYRATGDMPSIPPIRTQIAISQSDCFRNVIGVKFTATTGELTIELEHSMHPCSPEQMRSRGWTPLIEL